MTGVVVTCWLAFASPAATVQGRLPARDPAAVAREVFSQDDFWWKRLEPTERAGERDGTSVFAAIRRFLWSLIKPILDFLAWLFSIPGAVLGGGRSLLPSVVWLVAIPALIYGLWKLAPILKDMLMPGSSQAMKRDSETWTELPKAEVLLAQAQAALGQDRFADAIRLALLAVIAWLVQQGRIRFDSTRTNREHERALGSTPELAAQFARLARIQERVWYGRVQARRDDAVQALELCVSLLSGKGTAAG